jgi:hypothetical protein
MVLFVLAACRLLSSLAVSRQVALLSVAAVVNLPSNPYRLAYDAYTTLTGRTGGSILLNAESWLFTPNLMLNSLLALSVGLLALWAIVRSRTVSETLLACVCLAAVVALKPQYFIGFVVVGGSGVLVLAVNHGRVGAVRHLSTAASLVACALAFAAAGSNPLAFTGIDLDLRPLMSGWQLARESLMVLAISLIALAALSRMAQRLPTSRALAFASGAAVGWIVLYVGVAVTTVLLDPRQVALARSTGLDYSRSSQDFNFDQVLLPGSLCVCLVAVSLTRHLRGWLGHRRTFMVLVAVIVVGCLPVTVAPLASPRGPAAYEVAEEVSLSSLVREADWSSGVWVSSDLADPAQDFARPLRGTTLTFTEPAQFYVANVAYGGLTQPDVGERVANNDRFFSTPWSPWHETFLKEEGVRFVLVRERCPAAWAGQARGLALLGARDDWQLFETTHDASTAENLPPLPDALVSTSSHPRYGLSDCRTGGTSAR